MRQRQKSKRQYLSNKINGKYLLRGIKEFTNYVNKKNSGPKGEIKDLKKRIAGIESGEIECEDKEAEIAACRAKITEAENKLFKPVIGCEMYVARRTMDKKEGKPDQSGYHLIVLAKNEKGYHNLIKLVSRAWTMGYYMRPRTDRNELEKYQAFLHRKDVRSAIWSLLRQTVSCITWKTQSVRNRPLCSGCQSDVFRR